MQKSLIAMSGGVDSSLAAKRMVDRGYDCIGCTMKLYHNEDVGIDRLHTCCSLEDVEAARSVAYKLGMPYYVFNFTDAFHDTVIRKFIESYEQGITPNPCIDCNRYMKFDKLYERAKVLGCEYVVTGHYARIEEKDGVFFLKKALDETKDQSYVLYSMTQQQLARTLFPLGNMRKTEVRQLAEQSGFVNAHKPDSQDICFVPNGDYASIIELQTGKKAAFGNFVDKEGNVLGRHRGVIHYTIGQRRDLASRARNRCMFAKFARKAAKWFSAATRICCARMQMLLTSTGSAAQHRKVHFAARRKYATVRANSGQP